jgi:prepilin-type processing-associated H-X9-DG protein/prepilin-type N-terminal cleavage/methylation domain-containing protein
MPDGTPRRAFTLIELLFVVVIIGSLVLILLPALSGARKQSRLTHCSANVRSIGAGLEMYADSSRDMFPYWSVRQIYGGDGSGEDSPGLGWTEQLEPYIEGTAVFADPARPAEVPFAYFLQSRYVFTQTNHPYTALKRSKILFNVQYVLAGDCNNANLFIRPYGNNPHTLPDCDLDDASEEAVFFPGELRPHDGNSNILYGDGHVEHYSKYQIGDQTWHPTSMRDWSMQVWR